MATISVLLTDGRWVRQGPLSVCGHAFYKGRLRDAAALSRSFAGVESSAEFEDVLRKVNGFFAVVCETRNGLLAAVDRVRSIPLFFRSQTSSLCVTDRATTLGQPIRPRSIARAEFRLTGFVSGQETLSPNIRQIQAGEMLVAEESRGKLSIDAKRYFRFTPRETSAATREQLLSQLDGVVTGCINRLIARAAGRTILLPLSGGWDSRLIATMLKKQGYDNVLCFSYGRPGNSQSAISNRVAAALGFSWVMVPYTEAAWQNWFHSESSEAYATYSHNLVSIPHYQDWPAIWELKMHGLLPEGALVAPGHLGDFAAGSHIPPILLSGKKSARRDIVQMIYQRHYNLWPLHEMETREALLQRVDASLCPTKYFTAETAAAVVEEWDWAERQAKFIVNAVRAYEFWGVDWWMPLADAEFLEFWTTVAIHWRVRQRLYVPYVTRLYRQVAGISVQQANERDGARLQGAVDRALKLGCYELTREAYRRLIAPVLRVIIKKSAYKRDPLAWYGIMDIETFRREFSGRENFHSFISRYVLGDLSF